MKRCLAVLLAALLAAGLTACGGGQPAPAAKDKAPPATAAKEAPKEAPKEQPKEQPKFPEKPISFIIAYEPGSASDVVTRPFIEAATKRFGQPVVVVNKPGASGSIGLKDVHDAKPDGYTVGQHTAIATNKLQGISPLNHRSFDMLGIYHYDSVIISCSASRPWKNVKELAEYAKANPGKVSANTSAKGGITWLGAVAFENAADVKLNIIPTAGGSGITVTQVAGGHVDLAFTGFAEIKAQLDAGNVRFLGVMGPERFKGKYSDVPTLMEMGYKNVDILMRRCAVAPKGLPKPVFDKLVAVFGEAAQSPEYKKFAEDNNGVATWIAGEKALAAFDDDEKLFRPILEKSGLLKEAK